jgi:hypothetical protein
MSKRRPISVSDHALVRWLQRVEGLDVEALRDQIAASAAVGVAYGARIVVVSGGKLILDEPGESVVTVLRPDHVRRQEAGICEISVFDEISSRRRPKRGRRR